MDGRIFAQIFVLYFSTDCESCSPSVVVSPARHSHLHHSRVSLVEFPSVWCVTAALQRHLVTHCFIRLCYLSTCCSVPFPSPARSLLSFLCCFLSPPPSFKFAAAFITFSASQAARITAGNGCFFRTRCCCFAFLSPAIFFSSYTT